MTDGASTLWIRKYRLPALIYASLLTPVSSYFFWRTIADFRDATSERFGLGAAFVIPGLGNAIAGVVVTLIGIYCLASVARPESVGLCPKGLSQRGVLGGTDFWPWDELGDPYTVTSGRTNWVVIPTFSGSGGAVRLQPNEFGINDEELINLIYSSMNGQSELTCSSKSTLRALALPLTILSLLILYILIKLNG